MKIETDKALQPRVPGIASLYVALAALIFFFAFYNLDSRLLWGDEAETAVLAKNILKFGVPKVDDGVNHISLHGDKYDARNGVWTWSPWLPDYVTAASFAVFGPTTWAARAPFTVFGWLSVMLLGAIAWKIYHRHRIALAAMLLLGTSEVFLLHLRQCRYYSITVLAEILLIYGIYQILAQNKHGAWWIFSALTLQFYCNYTIAAANIPILLVLTGVLLWQKKSSALPLIVCLVVWFLASCPWLLYSEVWRQSSVENSQPWTNKLWFYARQIHFHFFPWCVLLLPFLGWLYFRFSKKSPPPRGSTIPGFEKYLLLLPVLYLPVLLIMPYGFSRYFLPMLPVMCLLVSVWLFRYLPAAIAVTLLIVQCTVNVFAVVTNPFGQVHPIRSPLAGFIYGVQSPYENRFSGVLKYLKANAHPGDVLISWDPELPLVFYTRLKVVDARLEMPPSHRPPDWILPQSAAGDINRDPIPLPDSLKPYYKKITLTVHDSPRVDDIPEPDVYQYQTTRATVPFVIYRLNSPTNQPVSTAN